MNTEIKNVQQAESLTAEQLKNQKAHLGHPGEGTPEKVHIHLHVDEPLKNTQSPSQTLTADQLKDQKTHLDHVPGVHGQLGQQGPLSQISGGELKDQKAHLDHIPGVHGQLAQQGPLSQISGGELKDQKAHLDHVPGVHGQLGQQGPLSQISGGELKDQKAHLDHIPGVSGQLGQQGPLSQISGGELKDQKSHLGHVEGGQSQSVILDPTLHQKEMSAVHHYRQENASLEPQNYLPPADLSGVQHSNKIENAQDVLKQVQGLMKSGGNLPPGEVLDDALHKARQFLVQQSSQSQLDADTKKTLEDLANLLGSANQLAKDKDLVDRLQKIGDETAKATQELNQPGVSAQTREASLKVVDIVNNWRPLFQLLITSRDFRVLIADTVQIFRRVLIRHKSFDEKQIQQKFVEGTSPIDMAKDVARDTKESFKNSEGDLQVKISDEEFDDLGEDMARVLLTLAKTPTYRSGLERIFRLLDIWRSQLSSTKSRVSPSVEPHAEKAQAETKELVVSFAGREPLDNFMNSLHKLVDRVNQDSKTQQYLYDLKQFILDTKSAESLSENETKERLKKFAREGRELVEQYKYADEINDFLDKSDTLVENIKRDEMVSILREQAGLVAEDLSYVDEQGNVKLDTSMLGKLRGAIAPVLAESLKYVPIPRIEDHDKNRHFWVDNIVLCGYDVIPDKIRVQMESDSTINIREIQTDASQTRLILTLKNIRTELKNLDFYYHKKTFPHFTEQGKVTLSFPGDGASLVITYIIEQPKGATVPAFRQGLVDFQIHDFQVNFDKDTLRHDVLAPMFTSMFKSVIERQIELSVERNIGGLVNRIGEQLSASLMDINRPMMMGMDKVRSAIKASEVGTIYDKRREILE